MTTELSTVSTAGALTEDKLGQLVTGFFAGLKGTTLRAYQQSIEDFRQFTGAESTDGAAKLLLSQGHGEANHLVLSYRANMIERELSAATVNARLSAVRSLVACARTIGLVGWTLDVKNVKSKPYRDTRGPGAKGYRMLVGKVNERQDAKAVRDRAILALLFERALRRAEVVSLDVEHVDLEAGTLSIIGKGNTEREALTLATVTREALAAWLAVRGNQPGPLFTNCDRAKKGSGRLDGCSVYRLVRRLGERTGQKARPHGLRHAAITSALDLTNGDVRKVRAFSRHARVEILLKYDDSRQDHAGAVAELISRV